MANFEDKSARKIERQITTKMRLCADQTPSCKQIELNEKEDAEELCHRTLCAPLPICVNKYNRDDQKTVDLNADPVVKVDVHDVQEVHIQITHNHVSRNSPRVLSEIQVGQVCTKPNRNTTRTRVDALLGCTSAECCEEPKQVNKGGIDAPRSYPVFSPFWHTEVYYWYCNQMEISDT